MSVCGGVVKAMSPPTDLGRGVSLSRGRCYLPERGTDKQEDGRGREEEAAGSGPGRTEGRGRREDPAGSGQGSVLDRMLL